MREPSSQKVRGAECCLWLCQEFRQFSLLGVTSQQSISSPLVSFVWRLLGTQMRPWEFCFGTLASPEMPTYPRSALPWQSPGCRAET